MRRVLVLVLALVLALGLFPAAAFADEATPFSASGLVCLTGLPTEVEVKETPTGLRVEASGETLGGLITGSDWGDLPVGTLFAVTVEEEKSFFSFGGTFSGKLKGSFTLGSLEGELKGTVSGLWNPGLLPDLLGSISSSAAEVKWKAEGDEVEPRGVAEANFSVVTDGPCVDPETGFGYGGTISFSGSYKQDD